MADWNWATGRLTRVVHPVGKFANGDNRYRRAQFDFLKSSISGSEEGYVIAPPADRQSGAQESISSSVQGHEGGSEFGFYTNETIIVDVGGHPDPDTWPALHVFGFV